MCVVSPEFNVFLAMGFCRFLILVYRLLVYRSWVELSIRIRNYRLWQKKREKTKTLNGRLPLEDSSVFDDPVLVLIVMT